MGAPWGTPGFGAARPRDRGLKGSRAAEAAAREEAARFAGEAEALRTQNEALLARIEPADGSRQA